jgi:hypothetical protein
MRKDEGQISEHCFRQQLDVMVRGMLNTSQLVTRRRQIRVQLGCKPGLGLCLDKGQVRHESGEGIPPRSLEQSLRAVSEGVQAGRVPFRNLAPI